MAKRVRRNFTEEFKQQLMSELKSGRKLIDVAAEHKIQPSQISQWKRKMGGGSARKRSAAGASGAQPKGMKTAAAKSAPKASPRPAGGSSSTIDELERMIGQLTVENARLRRELGR